MCLSVSPSLAKMSAHDEKSDIRITLTGKYKPESFYAYNVNFFNENNAIDKIFYARHIYDLNIAAAYGEATYEKPIINFYFTLRNKANWGNVNANGSTTESTVKINDTVTGAHRHFDTRLKMTLRDLWMSFNIGRTLGLSLENEHTFMLGLFPFELGRGIALGPAYAVGPGFLGFYSDAVIDQFAPGAKLSGTLIPKQLTYDFYVSIIENLSTSISETGAKIYAQEYGRRFCPERGFGNINFLAAGRFFWTPFDNNLGKCVLEPYWLYNNAPEQVVAFRGDANSKLATVGLACEYVGSRFDLGFDYAVNLGRQKVFGWDCNQIKINNIDACLKEVNSHAVDKNGVKIPHDTSSDAGKQAQQIINDACQDESENGKFIGVVDQGFAGLTGPVEIFNSKDRFRDGYNNKYEGWMFVCDIATWAHNKDLRFAAMAGVASGDDNPNVETIDGNYRGFIGLQEIYSGGRVMSTFFLGGSGKAKRFLSEPRLQRRSSSRFSPTVSGVTNIVFVGGSMKWEPLEAERRFKIFPNILAYWQERPIRKFDIATRMDIDEPASTFLGVELNTFLDFKLKENLNLYWIWAVYFPGSHYKDIQGKPLNEEQLRVLDRLDTTGFNRDRIPNISDDIAFTLNLGIEFKF